MEIVFIGTGSGKTSRRRNHSSILFRTNNSSILIDCGDGTAKALLQQNVGFNSIDTVIISHLHADHYSGIAALITQMKLLHRKNRVSIYIHKNFVDTIRSFIDSTYMFSETLGFDLRIIGFELESDYSISDGISFCAKQNSHIRQKKETKKYPDEMFVSTSLLLYIERETILYTSDIGTADDLFLFGNYNIDIMIAESSHVSLHELYSSFRKINPSRLFITHISDELEPDLINWQENLPAEDKNKITICNDGLIVTS